MFSTSELTLAARCLGSLGQEFEPQRTGDRRCFYQTNLHDVTQSVHGTTARSDQRMAGFIEMVEFAAERSHRDQAVGARFVQFDEQTCFGDAGDPAFEDRADAIGEEMRDQAVGGFTLGLHGAAFGE